MRPSVRRSGSLALTGVVGRDPGDRLLTRAKRSTPRLSLTAGRGWLAAIAVATLAWVGVLAAGPSADGAAAAVSTWTSVTPATSPSGRFKAAMAYDPATKQVVLFGGATLANGVLGDTWTWNGANWTQQTPLTAPSARGGAGMAYDASSRQLILFGGNTGSASGETWTWTGTTWAQLQPATSPPAASGAAMAYDPATSQILMFGGSGKVLSNATWAWNGTTWTKLTPGTVPDARANAAMAYDQATGQVVMFGGENSQGALGDTWLWKGSDWVQERPPGNPGPRTGASLTYDATTRQPLLVAGVPPSGPLLGDTWSWNGSKWIDLNPATSIDPRFYGQAAFDAANHELVGFSGATSLGYATTADTWLYGPLAISPQALSPATVGARYSATLGAIAGTGPDTWSVTSRTLPAGLALSAGGVITGTPTTAGTSSFAVTVMDSGSPVAQASRTLTLKVNPPPKAAVWVTNGGDNFIHSFPLTATGNARPSVTIGGPQTGLNTVEGIAVDKTGVVYASNSATPSITVYAPGASGNVAPVRTISGPDTGLSLPAGIALDDAGQLYVAEEGDNAVTVYKAGAQGDAPPVQTISGPDTELSQPMGVVIDSAADIWAASAAANLLTRYASGATGDAVPTGVFRGVSTTLDHPVALAQDTSGRVLAANIFGESVSAFAPNPPFGNTPPAFTISGSQSQLSYPRGLDVDNADNLYVANQFGGVNVYAPNSTTPAKVITGAATGLVYPGSLAVAPPLSVATASLPTAAIRRRYTAKLVANLGTAPTRWRITHGRLPKGLKLARSGLVRGTPRQLGAFRFTVAVTDSTGHVMRASRKLTLAVRRAPVVTGIRPAQGKRPGRARVKITGSGFAIARGATIVQFGRLRALAVNCHSHTRCIAQAPPRIAGRVYVTVSVHGLISRRARRDRYLYHR